MDLLNALDFFDLAAASLLIVGVGILFFCRLYTIVNHHNLLQHFLYWLLHHLESLLVALFHLVELLLMLLLNQGKKHFRVVLLLFFLSGFFFDVVDTVEFGSRACHGDWKLRTILVQFSKVYIDVGPCFFACDLLLPLDQALLYELIGLPYLGDGNYDLFITTGCDVPGADILGETV